MKTLALLSLLVAGVAGAQPATTNCRSSAANCSVAGVIANTQVQVQGVSAGIVIRDFTGSNGYALWIDRQVTTNRGLCLAGSTATGVCLNSLLVDGTTSATFSSQVNTVAAFSSSIAAGSNAFQSVTGAWWDLGGGSFDRMKSDGTNVVVDTNLAPTADNADTLGTAALGWLRAYFDVGAVLNTSGIVKWSAAPVSDNTEVQSQVLYNQDAQEVAFATATRKYSPLGGAKDWVVEKRTMVADNGFESTTCPTASPGLRGTGAGALTYSCTDAAAATNLVVVTSGVGESYRQSNTTAVANAVSLVDVSAASTELRYGPKLQQRVSIPAGSTANVRIWVALVPTATSLTGVDTGAISVVGFRFSTAVPDTNWQACSGDGASVACTNTGIAPATDSNIVLEIDCRETTACRFLINGSLVATRNATLPTSSTQLGQRVLVQTLNATAKTLGFGRQALQTN